MLYHKRVITSFSSFLQKKKKKVIMIKLRKKNENWFDKTLKHVYNLLKAFKKHET